MYRATVTNIGPGRQVNWEQRVLVLARKPRQGMHKRTPWMIPLSRKYPAGPKLRIEW